MRILVTAGELISRGVWGEFCELAGVSFYAVSEGVWESDHEITLTSTQAFRLGLIKMNADYMIEVREEEA